LLEKKNNDGLERIEDVLKDPRVIMDSFDMNDKGIYNELNDYFNLLNQDPDKVCNLFKGSI